MYISEMIKRLVELKEKYGDLSVCTFDPEAFDGLTEVSIVEPDEEKPSKLQLV